MKDDAKKLLIEDYLPNTGAGLAEWFSEGVRHEIKALEKEGSEQRHELISGRLCKELGVSTAIYEFIIADATRIIEDSSGRLITKNDEYSASVVSQQANRIYVQIEAQGQFPLNIPGATLIIDDTALLRRLLKVLEERSLSRDASASLAVLVFHPYEAKMGHVMLPKLANNILPEQRRAIEYACGSSVTYIWGPPGTGKTFVIAHLIRSLIESGERILVCSHTNAAVNQALSESLDKVLKNSGLVEEGKVVRVGHVPDESEVPGEVQLKKIVEKRAASLMGELQKAEQVQEEILVQAKELEGKINIRKEINRMLEDKRQLIKLLERGNWEEKELTDRIREAEVNVDKCRVRIARAMVAWFFRELKCRRAQNALEKGEGILRKLTCDIIKRREENRKLVEKMKIAEELCEAKLATYADLPCEEDLVEARTEMERRLNQIQEDIRDLQEKISLVENEVIGNAVVIFGTLTKNYTESLFQDKRFDAVIIDEVSMALPPLIFLAAEHATQRVVLVGDFMQLPPIVRSDSEISNERLATDTYHLAGVVGDDDRPIDNVKVLRKLETQRRMVPEIANIVRDMVYRPAGNNFEDHECVKSRDAIPWLDFLPEEHVIIVDTADLHCWSGKQPGSLSRFNMGSAIVSVRLAAEAAARIKDQPKQAPIGIVTPFTAQRRLLSKLIGEAALNDWVVAGTVHTFQGHEADFIIFDSVLDEPYYTARLCSRKDIKNVMRDLNVACTRAKNKFVFVGSSEWLNKCAKPPSGLGKLWEYLKKSKLISVNELLDSFKLSGEIAPHFDRALGWKDPKSNDGFTILMLDERSFYDHFCEDISKAKKSIFALAPYFGQYRWPKVQAFFAGALERGITVTIVTPPISEVTNTSKGYVQAAIKNLRELGAVVVSATGLHGKDVIIDEKILYTGSLNWSSQRESVEVMHRINAPEYAKQCYEYLQVKHIRQAAVQKDGTPRVCPYCGWLIHIVNQRRQHKQWDFQAMKVGCTNINCPGGGYLRDVNERPAFTEVPRCQIDGHTKYRCVRRGRGRVWTCPKHPKECPSYKWIPGDPELMLSRKNTGQTAWLNQRYRSDTRRKRRGK